MILTYLFIVTLNTLCPDMRVYGIKDKNLPEQLKDYCPADKPCLTEVRKTNYGATYKCEDKIKWENVK